MGYQLGALAICAVVFVYVVLRRRKKCSPIRDVPGPVNPSWVFGHQWYHRAKEADVVEKGILEEFGNVVRLNGPLGEDRLWVADPMALNHILQKSGYLYARPSDIQERSALLAGHGLLWAEGDVHQRQRRVMTPAFGPIEAKGLFPYFLNSVNKMADKWSSVIENGRSGDSATIDVSMWMGKATLDAIGSGAFDYDFGALDDADNPLAKSYMNLIHASFGNASRLFVFLMSITRWLSGLLTWVYAHSNDPGIRKLRWNKNEAHVVARKLLESKRQELEDGAQRRDIMSLLVKASASQRQDRRLTDEEITSQVRTIMLAGHETTAKTLTFALWELANHHDFQEKLRAEINDTLTKVKARGDADFTANDLEKMPHLVAFTKETLRVHSIATEVVRTPIRDDIIPLTKPIVGASGRVYTELPVPKGTAITISISGYNLNQHLWGPDAYVFRPERWFEMGEKVESPVGVYGNLSTFSGGTRGCIGWRFAVIEMQAFLVTLIRRFDISHADNHPQIRWTKSGPLIPIIIGEEHKGAQLPLKITAIRNE